MVVEELLVWTEHKEKSEEGHHLTATLLFNGKAVWGPRGCHENTMLLAEALTTADYRFTILFKKKEASVEGHTRYISVWSKGKVTLDKLSTHDNMDSFADTVNDIVRRDPMPPGRHESKL